MAILSCISPSIKILRARPDDVLIEDYSHSDVFFLSYRLARLGGCIDARFNVIRDVNAIGSLAKGDRIEIYYSGTVVWFGTVNDFESLDQDLEIRCIGTWGALKNVFPNDLVYGTGADYQEADSENEFSDINNSKAILIHLFDKYLDTWGTPGSDITKISLSAGAATLITVERLELTGARDFGMIAEYLGRVAGDWSVGIDEKWDFYLTNPATYPITEFRACEGAAYQITSMIQEDSVSWLSYPTSLVIKGIGDYQETFNAEDFGYKLPSIAGIPIRNQRVLFVPYVKETEEKIYVSEDSKELTVESIDAARYADMFFHSRAIDDPRRFLLKCQNVNIQLFPWEDVINIFDQSGAYRGKFTIEVMEYISENSDLTIESMHVQKLRPVS